MYTLYSAGWHSVYICTAINTATGCVQDVTDDAEGAPTST